MGNRQEDILGVASALTDPARREESARALARLLGADAILLFISDPQLSTLLPAPGFPQTLPGGRAWKAFLRACEAGPAKTELTSPYTSAPTRVAGLRGADGSVLALLGGDPDAVAARTIIALLPLLAASFRGEQMAVVAEGHARVAQETAAKSRALAESLDAARRQLQQLNRAKDEFLAMLSHELRNPLGAISNATRLLEDQIPENIAARRPLGIVRRQIGHMTQLVNDLMDVARITQGKIVLQKKSVALMRWSRAL